MQLLLQSVLSLVPVEQRAQDGGETVLSQRAHGAYQLEGEDETNIGQRLVSVLAVPHTKVRDSRSTLTLFTCTATNKNSNSTRYLVYVFHFMVVNGG